MKNILFYKKHQDMQGTTRALIDYALYNEKLLGNKSIIAFDSVEVNPPWDLEPHKSHVKSLINSLKQRFEVFFPKNSIDLENFIRDKDVHSVYNIKSGEPEGFQSKEAFNLNHAVFPQPPGNIHGHKYAFVSKWLSDNCSQGKVPYVPHMVYAPLKDYSELRKEVRKSLDIPNDGFVYGRIGGYNDFNLPFVYSAIEKALSSRKNLYFIFICTKPFIQHERVIYLDPVFDLSEKFKLISACDAMIHARHHGETFGLAIAEFCSLNKPILTWRHGVGKGYIEILKDDAIYYDHESDLLDLLLNFIPDNKDYNSYKDFSPKKVMEQFDQVFLK